MGFGEISIPYWEESGHILKICKVTVLRFWTRDSNRSTCGDTNEDPYTFIGNPIIEAIRSDVILIFNDNPTISNSETSIWNIKVNAVIKASKNTSINI